MPMTDTLIERILIYSISDVSERTNFKIELKSLVTRKKDYMQFSIIWFVAGTLNQGRAYRAVHSGVGGGGKKRKRENYIYDF
jgi:hypothetical protein